MKLSRTTAPLEEDLEDPSRTEPIKASFAKQTSEDGLTFEDVSVLGLQRSVKVTRRPAVKEEDAEGGSVLGLQRSVKVMRRQAVQEDTDEAREQAAFSVFEV